jgi:hypothetical protein
MQLMPSTLCPFCERIAHMTIRWGIHSAHGAIVQFAATCDNCSRLSSAQGRLGQPITSRDTSDPSTVEQSVAAVGERIEWWPKVGTAPAVNDVPDPIARAAREAYSSASVGNHMAAILMARTVVEATAKANEITSGNLSAKINAMMEAGLIRPAIAAQAHEVRFAGNDMAHGDVDVAPESADSEEILALMAEILSEVFQGPARLERIRQKRVPA